jgi:hypothetical protein
VPEESPGRSARADALWADTKIDPIEIALPGGVGYTLRGYRPASDVAGAGDDAVDVEMDDFDAAAAAVARRRLAERPPDTADTADTEVDDGEEAESGEEDGDEEADEEDLAELAEAEEAGLHEDVPVFLSRRGRLLLFHSPDKLVDFVRSDAEHDLRQLDTWVDLAARIEAEDVQPLPEDSYELDLVVENLRGGSDVWDLTLILKAGEIARDIAFALRMETIMTSLSAGSPLDDLDETLRTVDAGGVKAFLARWRMRKIPAQQSALAWRTIIGKISAVADWRD